ncbi:WcaI family glycosyltransferase [Novosphingobium sp.]|uniref:WcaI family glycosyltransferase n=1 Tax=Novosphingobium sp. TaxID=1874826 RepID=UPI00261E87EE|nr:WcaI family glycosyltransferase [Novosphingobium sp.]
MKLLILGLNYAPEPVGIGPYTTGLAEEMASRGHQVEVVAGKPYYPQWRPYAGQPKGRTDTVENGVNVTRVPHYVPATPNGSRRLLHHASFALSASAPMMAAARQNPDLVLAIAPSLMSVPIAARAAGRAHAPLWVHIQDFEVEAAFATNLVKGGGPVERCARAVEHRILQSAARVSTISPQMCAKLIEKGVPPERIYELRNWSNATFAPNDTHGAAYRQEWGIGDRKVALYSGNIANKQGIEIVIEAAQLLRHRSDLVFVICGEGPNRIRLAQMAEGLANVQLHDLQPAERMGDLLSLASLHLLPQIPGAADLVLPSKLTNMLQSGRPVIATADPGTGLYAEVDGCGRLAAPGDAQALADAIISLIDDEAARLELGQAALVRARERWGRKSILDSLESAIQELVRGRSTGA